MTISSTQDDHPLAPRYDVVVIGTGVSGIYQIKKLTDLGIDAVAIDEMADVGGTWYMNRYPGARFDSESWTYGYSFSRELLDEWHWKEAYSSQPENLKYLKYVVEKFDLRKHMRFGCKVDSMVFDEKANEWELFLADGRTVRCRYVITTVGLLTVPTPPRLPGMDDFEGPSFHTFDWPHEPVEMAGKRVGVIGTGATGIQVIGEIADKVDELYVFQRRPNWSAPLNNRQISDEEMADIRARYDEIFATCAQTPGGFEHEPDRRGFWSVTPEERVALWDYLYDQSGFSIWLRNFREIFTDEEANKEFSDYIATRIRQRVNDPDTAERLIPRDHGFGVQRVPMETNYFEAYNRDNVHLVDLSETPIERITKGGIRTTERDYDLDLIVYATGFDAITGAFDRIDITGVNGAKLSDKWEDGPSTYLGVLVHDFPNFLMPTGPQSASASTNFPRGIENGVNWVTDLVQYAFEHDIARFDANPDAEQRWCDHVADMYQTVLMRKAKGWFTGYNSNIPGREHGRIRYFVYNGGAPKFVRTLNEVAEKGYEGITLTPNAPEPHRATG